MDILELQDRLNSFDVHQQLESLIYEHEDEILNLNKKQISEEGQDAYGNVIGLYSFASDLITKGRKRAGTPYDLLESGKFLGSFELNYQNGAILIYATDSKVGDIFDTIEEYGLIVNPEQIFGLTIEAGRIVNFEILLPALQERFNSHLE